MEYEQFFCPCPRGLEGVLSEELVELGATQVATLSGGVGFRGPFNLSYRINLESRIASRVLWRIREAGYRSEDDIYQAARALPWTDWFKVNQRIMVDVNARNCPLKSLDFVTLRIKDAICDCFRDAQGARPDVDRRAPDIRIYAYLSADRFTLYLDTSGEPLFKRGYRDARIDAPLKENLAAGILRLSGWKTSAPLLDPMCGSGTFLVEAAMMALNIAPGAARKFAFQKMLNFDERHWQELLARAGTARQAEAATEIFGADKFGDVLKVARANLAKAGVEQAVQLKQVDVLECSAPAPNGVMVMNPPYGVRLGEQEDLAAFYPKLGDVMKKQFSGWRAYIFTADPQLPKLIRLSASKRTPLFNGALECRLFEYKLQAGSMRKSTPDAAAEGPTKPA
jgi:putative N6-adenine-specific DNA methylase